MPSDGRGASTHRPVRVGSPPGYLPGGAFKGVSVRVVQWITGLIVVSLCGVGSVWLLSPREVDRLRREKDELARQRAELQKVVERLTGEDRVAEVRVLDQIRAGEVVNGKPAESTITTIEFVELDREQHPLPARRFIISDEVVYFDALVVKFEPEFVGAADELRGKSLLLFRRIFGEHQQPAEGYMIDPGGQVPDVYRVDPEPSEFEKEIWRRFWNYATDIELARQAGVRVAQGEAVYKPMRRAQVWTLTLSNTGDLNLILRRSNDRVTQEVLERETTSPQ